MTKKIRLLAVLAVAAVVGLIAYGEFGETVRDMGRLPHLYLVTALALASANYLLRLVRRMMYLAVSQIRAPLTVKCLVFFSGLAMSIPPAKSGELVKCYLLRKNAGVTVGRSAPVVVSWDG